MPPASVDNPVPNQASPRPGLRVLMVEDHADSSRILARLLAIQGYDVYTAPGVKAALAAADAEPFDLLISDIGLPDGSGLDLMRQLRARHGQAGGGGPIKGIAITGRTSPEDVQRSRDAGFAAHLPKPVDFDKLDKAIRELEGEGK